MIPQKTKTTKRVMLQDILNPGPGKYRKSEAQWCVGRGLDVADLPTDVMEYIEALEAHNERLKNELTELYSYLI